MNALTHANLVVLLILSDLYGNHLQSKLLWEHIQFVLFLVWELFFKLCIHPTMHLNVWILCEDLYHDIISSSFSFFSHPADAHPSYPPSMCVKREPHEASFAPFTPSSVGDSALADILPHQSSLSVDASYPAHALGHCYSQYTSQAFIAGTASSIRLHPQIKIKRTLFTTLILIVMNEFPRFV